MSSKQISLEETREQNIARNNEFLLQLFGSNVLSKQHDVDFTQNNQQNETITNANRNYADNCINEYNVINNQIFKQNQIFLYRNNEINELFGYLNNNLNESPALVNVGPSGCGKTDLALSVLNSLEVAFVHMSCKGFSNIKQFISSLWLATKKSLEHALRLYHSIDTLKSKIQDLLILQMKPPTKFIEYAYALGKIVSFLFNDTDEVNSYNDKKEDIRTHNQLNKKGGNKILPTKDNKLQIVQKKYFYVHLDSLDHISYREQISLTKNSNSLITNLLNLMYYSHPRVKVIANMDKYLPSQLVKPCLVIKYSSYDDKQMLAILIHRFKIRINYLKETNTQLIIDKINSLDIRIIENLDMETNHQIEFINKVYNIIIENIFSSYHHLANYSLIQMMTSITCGNHPKLVYDATISVWIALYGYIPEKYILVILSNILQLWPKRDEITSTNITNSPSIDSNKINNDDNKSQHNENYNINIESEQNSFIKRYSIISQPTSNQIQDAVLLVANLPNYSCDHNQLVSLSRKRKIEVSLQIAIHLNSINIGAASSSNNFNQTTDLISKKRIFSELDQLDSNTMKLNEWYQYCPIKVKYLIIAAFLAGMNPKESDRMKFIGDKVERRKKLRMGSDNNPDQLKGNNSSNRTELRNNQQKNNGFIQYFSLERLISIYVQIVSIITHESPKGYGDVSIYCTIKNLVEKHILKESITWSINRPMYTSYITQTIAEELAKSIKFNLHDFIYEKNRITML